MDTATNSTSNLLKKNFVTFLASEDAVPQQNINSLVSASSEWTTEQIQMMVIKEYMQ